MYNRVLSPRPTLFWRIVRRVGARLRWRALWRRGMRRVMWMPCHWNCRCATLPVLVDAALAHGAPPTAEHLEAWAHMAAESRRRIVDMTRDLFPELMDKPTTTVVAVVPSEFGKPTKPGGRVFAYLSRDDKDLGELSAPLEYVDGVGVFEVTLPKNTVIEDLSVDFADDTAPDTAD